MTHYTAEQLASFPWITSTDTLRVDHLADAMLGTFDRLAQDVPEPFRSDLQQAAAYASDAVGPASCDAWDVALDWAQQRLNELAPFGFYFGASDGDGACFGFWLQDDWLQALEDRGIDCEDSESTALLLAQFDDHGVTADSLCDAYCGTADGYTEAEAGADYAQTLADDIGAHTPTQWPFSHIDWQAAWEDLEMSDGYALIQDTASSWHVLRAI